jgi:hypothetical protein
MDVIKTPNQKLSPTKLRIRQLNLAACYLELYGCILSLGETGRLSVWRLASIGQAGGRGCWAEDDCLYGCCPAPHVLQAVSRMA